MEIQGVLYVDPQAARPAGFCEICGGEVYWPRLWCCRCGRRGKDAPVGIERKL